MIYFLIQTNRIARILAGSKKKICTKKPRFMSACAQLVIAFLLILLQLGIIVALLIIEPPQVRVHVFYNMGDVHLHYLYGHSDPLCPLR